MTTKSKRLIDVSVVIPCYNSAGCLFELVSRVHETLCSNNCRFEVILINDASSDETWSVIRDVSKRLPGVRGYDLQFNVGQFRTTLCGLEMSKGEIIVTMDDDLQHLPEDIPKLLVGLRKDEDLDCVIGSFRWKQHSQLRRLGSQLFGVINYWMYEKPRGLELTSFRAMKRPLVRSLCQHRTIKPVLTSLILKSTRRIVNVPIDHMPRRLGKSGYSFFKLLKIFIEELFSATTLPLKVIASVGFVSAMLSVFATIYFLTLYFTGGIQVPGFATLVLLISFFGGMSLLSLGMLGEYIIRITYEVSHAPRYILRQTTHSEENQIVTEDVQG